jgi:hypothetical protein
MSLRRRNNRLIMIGFFTLFHAATVAQLLAHDSVLVMELFVNAFFQLLPEWRNGRRTGLKILGP